MAWGQDVFGDEGLRRRLVAHARRFVRDADEAEDVVQEALLRVRQGRSGLRSQDRWESWVFRITRHAAIDHVRSRRVRRGVWASLPEGEASPVVHDQQPPPPTVPPESLLRGLPAHQRLIMGLHYLKGLSQPRLCRLTGLSPSALRVRLFRARQALVAGPGPLGHPAGRRGPGRGDPATGP